MGCFGYSQVLLLIPSRRAHPARERSSAAPLSIRANAKFTQETRGLDGGARRLSRAEGRLGHLDRPRQSGRFVHRLLVLIRGVGVRHNPARRLEMERPDAAFMK